MKPCPHCGTSTSETARSCEHCGAPLLDVPTANAELAERIRKLLASGQKIEAIKELREATGAGLAEAKQAVETIERGGTHQFVESATGIDSELLGLMKEGRKIEAIKRYRERTSVGLKEAKDFVEELARQHGVVSPRNGCLGVVLVLVIALILTTVGLARGDDAKISNGEKSADGWIVHSVESEYQARPIEIRVLLPNKLDVRMRRRVLFVLPVEAARESKYGDGLTEVKRCDLHNKHGLICVAPTFAHLPWYADHPTDKTIRQESYFVKVVVPFIDRTYLNQPPDSNEQAASSTRLDRDSRWLLGFSKSGWGAWNLIARHPDLFGRAAAWDAPLDMQRFDLYGAAQVFGTQEHFESLRVLPTILNSHALKGTTPRLVLTGYDNFRTHHETAHRLLDEANIPHVYRDGPKLKHVWDSGWVEEAVDLLIGLDQPDP